MKKNYNDNKIDLKKEIVEEVETKKEKKYITVGYVNVRKEPNEKSEVIDILEKNTILNSNSTDDNWISYKNGYVKVSVLKEL